MNIKDKIKEILSTGISQAEIAIKSSISKTSLNQYLNNTYPSDTSNIENMLIQYLEKYNDTKTVDNVKFFETSDVAKMLAICNNCQGKKLLGMIVGKSGYGKTTTLKKYANLEKVIYIECDHLMNNRDLIAELEESIGLVNTKGSARARLKGLKTFFEKVGGYLIILDEVDKLINKDTISKLETIRSLYDGGSIGIVIAGEPILGINIKRYDERFRNRIRQTYELKGIKKKEVKEYLQEFEVTEKAIEELIVRATNKETGCFRLLSATIENIKEVKNEKDNKISLQTIIDTSELMPT